MTRTAYSEQFGRELDVEQLARLCMGTPADTPIDLSLAGTREALDAAMPGLECPSCFAKGAVLIREGRSSNGRVVRQAHYRFLGSGEQTAHHPLCDFYRNDTSDAKREGSVDFGETKSALTRAIGQLVCVGIERKMFDQSDMRALRMWHFELRSTHQFRITRPAAAVSWCAELVGRRGHASDLPFQPCFGDLLDFDWQHAAARELSTRYRVVIERFLAMLPVGVGWFHAKERAMSLIDQHMGHTMFDATPLETHYGRTIALADFAALHWQPLRRAFSRPYQIGVESKGAPVLALCALLLFVSEWDLATAAEKLVALISAPQPSDNTLGNFIGLNPFHDVLALRLIKAVQDATEGVTSRFEYGEELRAEIVAMQARHAAYRAARSPR
ncbi:hypothetical protein [Burkholderia cenocepacia]|uniref:hypothetical protein n=1 Tax=Burkholderia cenocepacia TaxID=95486 RepID=UPI002ABE2782|nr:hypothetical protein [Burkholderia cenocepacia]